jgi:hypothetical protein
MVLLIPKMAVTHLRSQGKYMIFRKNLHTRLKHLETLSTIPTRHRPVPTHDIEEDNEEGEDEEERNAQLWGLYPRSPTFDNTSRIGIFLECILGNMTTRHFNLVDTDSVFYPLYFYMMYIIVGPWYLGAFIPSAQQASDRYAFFFPYGLWFGGSAGWIPLLDTWFSSLFILCYMVFPLIIYVTFLVPSSVKFNEAPKSVSVLTYIGRTGILLWYLSAWYLPSNFISYGYTTLLFAPGTFWAWLWGAFTMGRFWIGLGKYKRGDDSSEEDEALRRNSGQSERHSAEDRDSLARRRNRSRDDAPN